MAALVQTMGGIPIRSRDGKTVFLRDVANVEDAALVQTSLVRVNGSRQVYIPIYRQTGASTLDVINDLREQLPDIQTKLTRDDVDLKLVMDQSVYVRHSITSLAEEGILGAVLCSLVILLFLGAWRMTLIAVLTIPISVLVAIIGLRWTGNSINVMTLAGMALAIGPLVDSAIICLENTHRHLGMGVHPKEAALYGASEVALPELVASCCTLLVLAPLAFVPGIGTFLFKPMALAVAFCMVAAYLLSRTLVPVLCSLWLRPHALPQPHHGVDYSHRQEHEHAAPRTGLGNLFFKWEALLTGMFAQYGKLLGFVMRHRWKLLAGTAVLWLLVGAALLPRMRREFFPEVDAGAFEIYVRADSGTRLEETERRIADVEDFIKEKLGADLDMVISEIGVVADWSAAFTPNAGPMDAVVKVQLTHDRKNTAQRYVQQLRRAFQSESQFKGLEFAFDAGGMIRSALNEGKSTPINIRITGKDLEKNHQVARAIQDEVQKIRGVVDCHILQRLDYPQYIIDVDQTKAALSGLTQMDVMKNLVAALNSSIQYNKRNFWIDPVSHNQYYVGVQYREKNIQSLETLRDIQITSATQDKSIPLGNVATIRDAKVPTELTHTNLQTTIDLTMGVQGRDLGHVADDVRRALDQFGSRKNGDWVPYEPGTPAQVPISGSLIQLSGEYSRMQDTFRSLAWGLLLAVLLVYFLMVALFKSWLTPLVILSAVPVGLIGVMLMLYATKTAINVQSLLGVIFMVGIIVSNTVLMVDFAQHLRRHEKLSPRDAILKAASVRVRPVVMTALAALFALIPMALGIGKGSEANVPLGRAVIGGLLAGLVTTLFIVPALYSLVVRDRHAHPKPATSRS
jgi:multidrug efflux pump subunit AcrB